MADMDQFKWYALNDNVMGGVSAGNVTKDDDGNLRFFGKLSKKNRGGFASCRTELPENLLAGTDGLSLKVNCLSTIFLLCPADLWPNSQ